MDKRLRLIVVALAVLVIIPLIVWGFIMASENGTSAVSVFIAPNDATVEVGGQSFKADKTIRLKPGSYTVKISKDGFEADSQKIIVQDNKESSLVSVLLPVSESAKKWYQENKNEVLRIEGKAGELSAQQGQDFISQYPITKWLPIQKAIYSIGYKQVSENTSDGIIITISASEGYREAALQEIRDKGFDPTDFTIEFTNYRNPFNE